jgi:polyhydroxyalkanoate synthase
VYKAGLYTDTDFTFLLVSGGHNRGIVSEPGPNDRTYQIGTRRHDEPYVDADTWAEQAPRHEGSWWPEWQRWLAERSGPPGPVPGIGNPQAGLAPIAPAPGRYVLEH